MFNFSEYNLYYTIQDLNTTLTTSLLMLLALNMKPTNQEEKKKINWNIGFKYIVVDHTNIDKATSFMSRGKIFYGEL